VASVYDKPQHAAAHPRIEPVRGAMLHSESG
jgi:hypothetical protein